MTKAKVLVIEDDPDGLRSVQEVVRDAGLEVVTAMRGEDGLKIFAREGADVVLSDLVLPDIDGIEVMGQLLRTDAALPVLIMTAYGSVESSVRALQAGAYDYVTKPLDLDELQSKLLRAAEARSLRMKVNSLENDLRARHSAANMVAESIAMKDVVKQIAALADIKATVLVRGESGTGKELVARALHADGSRVSGPFVAVNCAAFSETLLDSELFGHEKGAFTGAAGQHAGAFERADGGTIFLDEVGDAPASVQVKLLRVLEEREIVRVGGSRSIPVDVRLVSATNRDLEQMVETGEFREDLYYRLKVVQIDLPPLRSRRADIRVLTDRFIAMASEEYGRQIRNVEAEYYQLLEEAPWPGNIRQLRNVVESSVVMATEARLCADALSIGDTAPSASVASGSIGLPPEMNLAEIERAVLIQTLERFQGNRSLTADHLGISRRTIQRKISDYNLPF